MQNSFCGWILSAVFWLSAEDIVMITKIWPSLFGKTTSIYNFMTKKLIPNFNYGYTNQNIFWKSLLGKAKNHCFLCSAVERHKFRGATLLKVASLDFAEDDELIKEIKADYDFIRNKNNKKKQ